MLNKRIFLLSLLTGAFSSSLVVAYPTQEDSDSFLQNHRNQILKANLKFRLPDEKKIEKTLQAFGLRDFLEQAKLGTKLAGHHLSELGIDMIFVKACHDYAASLKEGSESDSQVGTKTRQLWETKQSMVEALLNISTQI